jgi:hypothetical protein
MARAKLFRRRALAELSYASISKVDIVESALQQEWSGLQNNKKITISESMIENKLLP